MVVELLAKLCNRLVHSNPNMHFPDWSDDMSCRFMGPFREYVVFGTVYYASGEGRKCKKCSAFKVERRIRIW